MTAMQMEEPTPVFILIDRKGSGRIVHRGHPHGVSSVRTLCGKLTLRVDTAGILDFEPTMTRGHRPCPGCGRGSGPRRPRGEVVLGLPQGARARAAGRCAVTTLDWKTHHVNVRPKPCRICRQPAYMTDETATPCHKVCAEREAEQMKTTRRSA